MAYTGTAIGDLDASKPDGDAEAVNIVDDALQEIKTCILNDFYPNSGYAHKLPVRAAKPTAVGSCGFVYTKDVSAKAELFFEDEDGDEVQITTGGLLVGAINAGDKMFFYQDTVTGWTVDDTIQDNSMLVYKQSTVVSTGGSQSPISMTTSAQELNNGANVTTASQDVDITKATGDSSLRGTYNSAATTQARALYTVNAVTLTPYYAYVRCFTKD